jgi:hypothetical protein
MVNLNKEVRWFKTKGHNVSLSRHFEEYINEKEW